MNFLDDIYAPIAQSVESWNSTEFEKIRRLVEQGPTILKTDEQLDYYLYAYSQSHVARLEYAFCMFREFQDFDEVRIIDYGCGAGLAVMAYHDYLIRHGITQQVKQIILIDPSITALRRAGEYCCRFFPEARIEVTGKDISILAASHINYSENLPTLHLFSSILDIDTYELSHLAVVMRELVKKSDYNQFVCVSACYGDKNPKQKRMDQFYRRLEATTSFCTEDFEEGKFIPGKDWSLSMRTFVVESEESQKRREREEEKRIEKNGLKDRWAEKLADCNTVSECELFASTCPKAYEDLLEAVQQKKEGILRQQILETKRREQWEIRLKQCEKQVDYEHFVKVCPKDYNDLLVEAMKEASRLEKNTASRLSLFDKEEYWTRELERCHLKADYEAILRKCPSKYTEVIRIASSRVKEFDYLSGREKLGCRKWFVIIIIVILLPVILKWIFF